MKTYNAHKYIDDLLNYNVIKKNKMCIGYLKYIKDYIADNTICDCFAERFDGYGKKISYCMGTRESDLCSCKGNVKKCDFYKY